jgi:LytS/YehU family sensor histidine kinase
MNIAGGTEVAYVPVLLLQPIVENAIRHGLAGRTGTCRLDISARQDGRNLVIDIIDSGSDSIDTPTKPGLGIGLGVTRQRIQAMYGAEGKIDLEQLTDSRTRVRVVLPFASSPLFETKATEDD